MKAFAFLVGRRKVLVRTLLKRSHRPQNANPGERRRMEPGI